MVVDKVYAGPKVAAGSESVLSPEDAWTLIGQGALVVDVRTKAEFDSGALPAALNISHEVVMQNLDQLGSKDRAIVLYCRSGQRSGLVLDQLIAAGYTNVWNAGGYEKLKAAASQL